jgi:menaquinone-dependent protoporphyrinogen IX oxidase
MKTLVIYYSLGGSTRKVAERVAQHLSADMEEIKSSKSYESVLGFFKAATIAGADISRQLRRSDARRKSMILSWSALRCGPVTPQHRFAANPSYS